MKIVIPLDLCTQAEVPKEARQVERDHRDIVARRGSKDSSRRQAL